MVAVTAVSLAVAYVGEDAYAILETAYEIGFVALFVPLALGTHRTPRREASALAAMLTGGLVWGLHLLLGWNSFLDLSIAIPPSLPAAGAALAAYLVSELPWPR